MELTTPTLVTAAYLVTAILFILAFANLNKHETAKHGNYFGIAGITVAIVSTIGLAISRDGWEVLAYIVAAMLVGAVVGIWRARTVEMTGMPELIALLHSFVGLAAMLVAYNSFLEAENFPEVKALYEELGTTAIHNGEVFLGVFIGAVTLTGSIVAYLKLSARMKSAPLVLPARHWMNLAAVLVSLGLMVWFVVEPNILPLAIMTVIALLFGWHLVASIGGGDMPVVISMLNSYSGWAAAATGFLLNNNLLIVAGALVGSSGAYLSYIMRVGMNRSFISVDAGSLKKKENAGADD
jgi:NAD(P) transhydrogenase subunit beta